MNQYPLFLNLKKEKVAVFGGGKVALRKIKTLLRYGAEVEVMSRDYSRQLKSLAGRNQKLHLRPTTSIASLLKGARLAFAATSDAAFNQKVERMPPAEDFRQSCRSAGAL